MGNRIACLVPFCRRTRGDRRGDPVVPSMEWICGDHWRAVPKRLKRRRQMLGRMARRTADQIKLNRIWRADDAAWAQCKRAAIERAVGL